MMLFNFIIELGAFGGWVSHLSWNWKIWLAGFSY